MLTEDWHAQINHIVQKTTFEELKKWINEGKLQPNHKVKVTNLSWIEASKVPAFQKLFEARRTNKRPTAPKTTSLPLPVTIPSGKPRIKPQNIPDSLKKPILTPTFSKETVSTPNISPIETPKDTLSETKTETAQASIPFQIYEQKLAKAESVEEIKKPTEEAEKPTEEIKKPIEETENPAEEIKKPIEESEKLVEEVEKPVEEIERPVEETKESAGEIDSPIEQQEKSTKSRSKKTGKPPLRLKPKNRMSFVKPLLTFVAGCGFLFIFAWGAAYLWVFQFGGTAKADEKSISELIFLEEKLSTDKIGLRLKVAASEYQENQQKLDLAQETAKLEKQFELERKMIIENHQAKLLNNEFNNIFYFGSGGLIILFLLARGFYSHKYQTSSNQWLKSEADIHATEQSENHLTMPPDLHNTNPSDIHFSNSAAEGTPHTVVYQRSGNSSASESGQSGFCLSHRDVNAKFFCAACSNYFCEACLQVVNTVENNCPFCKVVCKPIGSNGVGFNLPENGMNPDFDYRNAAAQNIGTLNAFLISLLLSAPMSYFWVYEIAPRLHTKEVQVVKHDPQKSGASNVAVTLNSAANKGTDKVGSNTSEQGAQKTSSVSEPNGKQDDELNSEARKSADRRLFIQLFIGLFVFLFGGLMSSRFFGKKANNPVSHEQEA